MTWHVIILKNGEIKHFFDVANRQLFKECQQTKSRIAKEMREELKKNKFNDEDWKEFNKRLNSAIDFKGCTAYYWIDNVTFDKRVAYIYNRRIQGETKRVSIGEVDLELVDDYKAKRQRLLKANKSWEEINESLKDYGFTISRQEIATNSLVLLMDKFLGTKI